jgi:hypothetical protein
MADGRILARPAGSAADLLAGMRTRLDGRGFDPERMFIQPLETQRFAERAVQLRLSVLLRTYAGQYYTDSFEQARLVEQIRRGDEHIWFWGDPEQIALARAELARPADAPVAELALGTVTVLSAEQEFGPGHGELCRSGSVDRSIGAVPAILHRMIGYHSGADRAVHDRYHTLLLAARNRPSSAGVRGGEAVQHIHCQHVRSRFWGIVPFYVMQGDVIECTELRESNRDPADVRRALHDSPPWWFADPRDADYAEALCRLNFGFVPSLRLLAGRAAPADSGMRVILPPSKALLATNHATVRPDAGNGSLGLAAAVASAESADPCCVAVHLALDEPRRAADQAWLADRGYVLTAVSAPKLSWQRVQGQLRPVRISATGIWCRTRAGFPVIGPHYLRRDGADPAEQAVLEQLRSRLALLGATVE